MTAAANFDRIARLYRWMEYLTFGPALWRCRTHHLSALHNCRKALILGDGDGRFTAALLAANPQLRVDAVDSSATMLELLSARARAVHGAASRLRVHHADALDYAQILPDAQQYDLIVAHFFLDCFAQPAVESLTRLLTPHLRAGGLWLVSDFRLPAGAMRFPARLLVRSLYLAFRVLSGLRTNRLPDYAFAFGQMGLKQVGQHLSLAGMLTSEIWVCNSDQAAGRTLHTMQLPPQRQRSDQVTDPLPDPEPPSPSLPAPDPGVFRPDPPAKSRVLGSSN